MSGFLKNLFKSSANKASGEGAANDLVWLSSLNTLDDISALNLATNHLSAAFSDSSRPLKKRLDFTVSVDDHILPRAEKLANQYAKTSNLRPELEAEIIAAAYSYHRQSYLHYLQLVDLIAASPKELGMAHNALLIVIARAIDVSITMIKWRFFEHAPAPTNAWLQIYKLYVIAYKADLLDIPVSAFSHSKATTISAYVAQAALFGSLENANMQRLHYQIAAYLLKSWLNNVSFSGKNNKETHLFYLDLKVDACAKRTRHINATSTCRYWQIDNFEAKVVSAEQLTEPTNSQAQLPSDITLAEVGDMKALHETLQVLRTDWSKTEYVRQRRKENRHGAKQSASIAYGILEICNQVEHYSSKNLNNSLNVSINTKTRNNKSLDERLSTHTSMRREGPSLNIEPQHEVWTIVDESPTGIGAISSKESKSWVKPGKLVGLAMNERPPHVVIAMIRAVMPTKSIDQLHVGLEIIARFASWGQMRAIEENNSTSMEPIDKFSPLASSNSISMGFTALYLPIEADLSEKSTLIIPKIEYRANEVYEIKMNGTTRLVRLGSPIEAKDDWVKIVFPHVTTS